jgi:hypothetical protein
MQKNNLAVSHISVTNLGDYIQAIAAKRFLSENAIEYVVDLDDQCVDDIKLLTMVITTRTTMCITVFTARQTFLLPF